MREIFRQITQKVWARHKDLRLRQIVYILVYYNISFSWLLPLDDFQFIFLLRDSEHNRLTSEVRASEGFWHKQPCEYNAIQSTFYEVNYI